MGFVAQAVFSVIRESRFPQDTFMYKDGAVRSVVIMNRGALSRLPAKHQHLDKFIAHDSMTAIVAGFETQIRRQFVRRNRGAHN